MRGSSKGAPVRVRAMITPPDPDGRCRVIEEYASVDDFVRLQSRVRAKRLPPPPVAPPCDDAFVDQRSGLVPPDLYLRLHREGAFAATRVGKRIVARWGDVRAALFGRPASQAAPHDELDGLRTELGLERPSGR